MKTFGYIHQDRTIYDWVVGGETGVTYDPINLTGDWTAYQSPYEKQKTTRFDTNFCVIFAALRAISTLCNFKKKDFAPETLKKLEDLGYIVNGYFEFNEAFVAYTSGSQKNGNTLYAVWEAIRTKGLIPQKDWLQIEDAKKWEDLVVKPSQELLDKGKAFLDIVKINWEWLLDGNLDADKLTIALQSAPIQIVNPVCGGWTTSTIKTCGSDKLQHSELLIASNDNLVIADTYPPFVKNLPKNYYIPYAIKPTITLIPPPVPELPIHTFTSVMRYGQSNMEIYLLQKTLKALGLLKVNPTGNYLEHTMKAVKQFQINNGIPHNNGVQAGPQTIKALNALTRQKGVGVWGSITEFISNLFK